MKEIDFIHPVADTSREYRWTKALKEDFTVVELQFNRIFKARFRDYFDYAASILNGYITINTIKLLDLLETREQIEPDQSMEEAILQHYGQDAVNMIRELL